MNLYVRERICAFGKIYLDTLAAVLLPGGAGQQMLAIIMINNQDIESCFTEFFKQWSEREVDATWQKLIDALVATNKRALAKELTEALTCPVTVMGGPQQTSDQQQTSQQPQAVDQQNPQPQPPMQDNNHPRCGDKGTRLLHCFPWVMYDKPLETGCYPIGLRVACGSSPALE